MTRRRRICVLTGTRAEYGLLYWIMKGIQDNNDLILQIIVTGMHLSPEFGLTYRQIEKDGFCIDRKVEMLLSSDTAVGIGKSMGVGMCGFAEALHEMQPDILLVLGDRFEILAAVSAALVACIPIAHIHGGETTEGAFDDSIRHAISKMAHLHFTATEDYRKRVVQLGEQPDRVFNVGATGIDNIRQLTLLDRKELEKRIGLRFGVQNILVTFHPVTLEKGTSERQFATLLEALSGFQELHILFTKANADTNGRIINKMIDDYVSSHLDTCSVHTSLGQLNYLSALKEMDAVVGNSSSGLLEAPSLHVATVNIGDRQKGRIRAASIIDCEPTVNAIKNGLTKALSSSFQKTLPAVQNPYDNGDASSSIVNTIATYPLEGILKKHFYDLEDCFQ